MEFDSPWLGCAHKGCEFWTHAHCANISYRNTEHGFRVLGKWEDGHFFAAYACLLKSIVLFLFSIFVHIFYSMFYIVFDLTPIKLCITAWNVLCDLFYITYIPTCFLSYF